MQRDILSLMGSRMQRTPEDLALRIHCDRENLGTPQVDPYGDALTAHAAPPRFRPRRGALPIYTGRWARAAGVCGEKQNLSRLADGETGCRVIIVLDAWSLGVRREWKEVGEPLDAITPLHIVALLVIALLIFGPRRLPELGGAVGKTIREFQKSMNEAKSQVNNMTNSLMQDPSNVSQANDVQKPN